MVCRIFQAEVEAPLFTQRSRCSTSFRARCSVREEAGERGRSTRAFEIREVAGRDVPPRCGATSVRSGRMPRAGRGIDEILPRHVVRRRVPVSSAPFADGAPRRLSSTALPRWARAVVAMIAVASQRSARTALSAGSRPGHFEFTELHRCARSFSSARGIGGPAATTWWLDGIEAADRGSCRRRRTTSRRSPLYAGRGWRRDRDPTSTSARGGPS